MAVQTSPTLERLGYERGQGQVYRPVRCNTQATARAENGGMEGLGTSKHAAGLASSRIGPRPGLVAAACALGAGLGKHALNCLPPDLA